MAPAEGDVTGANGREAALDVRDVHVRLGGAPILHGADLRVDRGRLVALVGPNGAGKSTLARTAAGLLRPERGEVYCMGNDVRRTRGRRLARLRAFVPQRPRVPEGMTVAEAVRIGRSPHLRPLTRATRRDREAVEEALERTGTKRFAHRRLTTLSGGELQRVQIAVALAQEAPLLMADVPTSQLDLGATVSIARLLRDLAEQGLAVLLVVHDLALAAALADEVVVVSEGRTVASGEPREVLAPDRLREVWKVDARLDADSAGHTALRVDWLGAARDLEEELG
jgi:iron complex transport system ATP-binding protein